MEKKGKMLRCPSFDFPLPPCCSSLRRRFDQFLPLAPIPVPSMPVASPPSEFRKLASDSDSPFHPRATALGLARALFLALRSIHEFLIATVDDVVFFVCQEAIVGLVVVVNIKALDVFDQFLLFIAHGGLHITGLMGT